MITISRTALVLHTQVVRFHQLITIFIEWIWPEPVFKGSQHAFGIRYPLLFGFRQVITEWPEIHGQLPFLAFEVFCKMAIIPNVSLDIIVVDRVRHKPIEAGIAVFQVSHLTQSAVGNIFQTFGNDDANKCAVHLIFLLIFVRPPHTNTQTQTNKKNPKKPKKNQKKNKTAIPW